MSNLQLALQDLISAIAGGQTVVVTVTWEDTPGGSTRWVSLAMTRGLPSTLTIHCEDDVVFPCELPS